MIFNFVIPGKPVAASRPRFHRIGKFVQTHPVQQDVDFKTKIAYFLKQEGIDILDGPLSLICELFLPRPKSLMKNRDPDGAVYCAKRPDLDNFAKNLMDALNGIAWNDDGQVQSLRISKYYHEKTGSPRTEITIKKI